MNFKIAAAVSAGHHEILAESKDSQKSASNLNILLHTENFRRKSKAMATIARDTFLVNIMINVKITEYTKASRVQVAEISIS
jgi:glycerol kinase